MIKLLINITDLLKRLGLFVIVLLPFIGLVLVAVAIYVGCLGVCEIIRALSTHVFCLRQKKDIMRGLVNDLYNDIKKDSYGNKRQNGKEKVE